MIPSLEGRVAIPFAMSLCQIENANMNNFLAFFCSFMGCIIPVIPLIFVSRKIKNKTTGFLHDKFSNYFENKFSSKLSALNKNSSKLKKCFLLSTFVAIPLPLTGTWTGSIIGGLTQLSIFEASISVIIGGLISCIIVYLICLLFGNSVLYFLIFSLILLAIIITYELVSSVLKKRK